jgi:hypothetical protein
MSSITPKANACGNHVTGGKPYEESAHERRAFGRTPDDFNRVRSGHRNNPQLIEDDRLNEIHKQYIHNSRFIRHNVGNRLQSIGISTHFGTVWRAK